MIGMPYRFSLVLAFWICVAFVLGRLFARFAPRVAARIIAVAIAAPLVVYVFWSHITWHVAAIPVALVFGVFTYGHKKLAPGVLQRPE